jgi:hypothetical protein
VSSDLTENLIDRLAANLEPVRPMTPLPVTLAAVLGTAFVVGCVVLATYHPKQELWTTFLSDRTYASVLVGLLLAGAGGCLGTLASVIPGREPLVRGGMLTAVGGLLLAIGAAAVATPWASLDLSGVAGSHLMCIARGACFAVIPAAAVLYAATRGWSGRPETTVFLALVGTGAVGALLVHLTCPAIEPLHVLCTHTSTPLLMAVTLTAVLLPMMRRWAR